MRLSIEETHDIHLNVLTFEVVFREVGTMAAVEYVTNTLVSSVVDTDTLT